MSAGTRTPAPSRGGGSLLPPVLAWAGRSDVEQVRLYTVASLHTVQWFLLAMGALAAGARLGSTGPALVVLATTLALGSLASWVLRLAVAHVGRPLHLSDARLPAAVTAALAVALTAWGVSLERDTGYAVAVLGLGALGWVAGAFASSVFLRVAVAVSAVAGFVVGGQLFHAAYAALLAGFFGFTVVSSLWLLRIVTELDRARGTQAALAVAEERLRFSRDVHDVLGRHLSTIAVQSELAATLARRGDERTGDKILEVRATAHDALREARELARGYRPLDLAQELDGAVSLLRSAGIAAHADLDGLPSAWHEPVARVVREAVTNVLRHSDAGEVAIGFADDVVSIDDDGTPRPGGSADGSGLRTLAEELAPMGARLEASAHDDGFRVLLDLSGAAPPRASDPTEVGG